MSLVVALFGHRALSAVSPKCAQERTSTKYLDDVAMAANVTKRLWEISDIVDLLEAHEGSPPIEAS
jgi:hypothetical protein